MVTQQAQIKITLPLALKDFLDSKASKFGLPIASYVRHLIIKDVEDIQYPEFEASDSTIKAYKKAMKEKDKAVTIHNVEELHKFFKNL
jgi:predicted DNA-binding protein